MSRTASGRHEFSLQACFLMSKADMQACLCEKVCVCVVGVSSFRPTQGVARLVRQCESISASRLSGSSPHCVAMRF